MERPLSPFMFPIWYRFQITSALSILHRLTGVMRERTSIIVSHRISTVRDADQILVLDRGRIVERGTHDELVRRNGVYAELYRKQLLEEELAAS